MNLSYLCIVCTYIWYIYICVCVYDDDDDDDDHDHDHDLDDISVPFIVCICSTQHPRTAKCIVSTCRCMHAHTCMAVYRQTGIDASNRTAHTIPLHAIALHTVALHDHCTIPCHSIYMHILIIPQILVHLNILIFWMCARMCASSLSSQVCRQSHGILTGSHMFAPRSVQIRSFRTSRSIGDRIILSSQTVFFDEVLTSWWHSY